MKQSEKNKRDPIVWMQQVEQSTTVCDLTWGWMRLNKVFSVGCRSCNVYRSDCFFCSRATVL